MEKELNIFIIWENARKNTDNLLQMMKKKFEIRDVYEITWKQENFTKNLRRFYGANLPKPHDKLFHMVKFLIDHSTLDQVQN